ncbi:MAG: NAD(+)/NADH kinase, partial [Candidatus Marinimicrobia bacterium]|nr:NAD(+)/NADH kinase [Candidatus Neomarinimicrobiota bacterium]
AGGPIVVPALEALTVPPICPHSLSARSIVVPSSDKIVIRFEEEQEGIRLMLDGQVNFKIDSQAVVTARRANWNVQMVKLLDSDYYQVLRTKMGWSGAAKGART